MMVDPAVKTALVLCILLTGVCAAVLSHRGSEPATPVPPERVGADIPRRPAETTPPAAANPAPVVAKVSASIEAQRPGPRPVAIVTPSRRVEPPPSLSPQYPRNEAAEQRESGERSGALGWANADAENGPRTHRIVDGDTLGKIAERYLGAANRAGEIFAANRDVLNDPDLLPIGVELKIPPRTLSATSPTTADPAASLTPNFHAR